MEPCEYESCKIMLNRLESKVRESSHMISATVPIV